MFYEIKALSDTLIFIRWFSNPTGTTHPEAEFIADLQHRMDSAQKPVYFLSDLRAGRITDVRTLRRLGKLTFHTQYGGSTAFSESVTSKVFVGVFSKFADPGESENAFYKTLYEALGYLERIKSGITEGIDWQAVARSLSS